MNRNVLILAFCQAMLFTGIGLVISSSALIGKQLAPSPAWATLPLAIQYLTTLLMIFYVSRLMSQRGRRFVFVRGALFGTAGALLAALGIWLDNFYLFAAAGVFIGVHTTVAQFYRFAAAEAVAPEVRAKAISMTLAGGVLAAFIGPNLARISRDMLDTDFLASFLALAVVTSVAALLSTRLDLPATRDQDAAGTARPLTGIVLQGKYIVALLAAMIGYGVMNFLMTATPIAMDVCGYSFSNTATVIQWHLVAMFAPSFFTGDLIRKAGALPVMLLGSVLLIASAATNLSGTSFTHFEIALVVLGVGWNFLYIGGTTLLTETYTASEKSKAQAFNDALVFATLTASSLGSGAMVSLLGWERINLYSIPFALLVLGAILWLGLRSRRAESQRDS